MDAVYIVEDYALNFYTNVTGVLDGMDFQKWIRLVAVIGAYFLLRPYVVKFGEYIQAEEHAKQTTKAELAMMDLPGTKAKLQPNDIRGSTTLPDDIDEDEEDEEDEAGASGTDWGKKARRRQRNVLQRILEQEEALRKEQQGDEEDKDIADLLESDTLVDFKEGEDGW